MSTPIRPDRLTFPPDHQEPDLSRSDDGHQNDAILLNERPGSSRFKQSAHQGSRRRGLTLVCRKYTYNAPETSQSRQRMVVPNDQTRHISRPGQPPPFQQQHQTRRSRYHGHGHSHTHTHHTHKHRKVMPPPPTPLGRPVETPRPSAMLPPSGSTFSPVPPVSTSLALPNNLSFQRPVPMTPTNAPQRFIPPRSVSRLNTAANRQNAAQGHRMPFIPNGA